LILFVLLMPFVLDNVMSSKHLLTNAVRSCTMTTENSRSHHSINMKLSATSTLFVVAISGAISTAEATGILLLADKNIGDAGVDSLIAALVSEGHEVDVIFPEHSLTPEALQDSGHTCVIHLDGNSYGTSLSEAADVALVDMVQAGGGYITGQWMGYEHTSGGLASGALDDLVLLGWGSTTVGGNCGGCTPTLTAVPAQSGHQLLASVPASFSFYADAFDATPRSTPHADQVTIMTYGTAGGVGVTTRPLGDGHSVNFAWAAGYVTSLTLQDLNVQQLYKNAVNYACELPSASPSMAPSGSPSMAPSSISDRIEETCPCDPLPDWKNHGQYVKCVAHLTEDLVELGAITEAEKDAIVSASAQSECGANKKKTLLRG
jgi:hypothetical protein